MADIQPYAITYTRITEEGADGPAAPGHSRKRPGAADRSAADPDPRRNGDR